MREKNERERERERERDRRTRSSRDAFTSIRGCLLGFQMASHYSPNRERESNEEQ